MTEQHDFCVRIYIFFFRENAFDSNFTETGQKFVNLFQCGGTKIVW